MEKHMKKNNIMSIIFIVLGSCIFSYPFIASGYSKYQQKELQKEYEQVLEQAMEKQKQSNNTHLDEKSSNEILNDVESYNSNSLNDDENNLQDDTNPVINEDDSNLVVDIHSILPELEQASKDSQGSIEKSNDVGDFLSRQQILGMIEIEKIDLKMIVVEGTEWDNIRVTIGHMTQTAAFGEEGNCALAGHRGGTYGTFFKHVDQLEKEDEIKLTDLNGKVFIYEVYDQFITEPTDMSVIDPIPGETTLTLISCENSGKKRIIIHARLK
jgi:sortase A